MSGEINDVPKRRPWKIMRGDDVARTFKIYQPSVAGDTERIPWDLTDVTIAGKIRATEDSGSVLESFGVVKADQTTDKGVYTVSMRGSFTEDFPAEAVGDLKFTPLMGITRTLQRFQILVTPDVPIS